MLRPLAALVSAALLAVAVPAAQAQAPGHTTERVVVTNPADGTTIVANIFKPASASSTDQVPVILDSHGWGGSRRKSLSDSTVDAFLDAGFGMVSFDQRGHGESSGEANVQDPTKETEDVQALIDHVAGLDWVLHNRDGSGAAIANDPVLGAIGGSYGGGYQTMTALDETAEQGATRFDAIAPEITWYDLNESLAPQSVPRTAWTTALYAAGASMLPQYVHEGFAWGASTGQWPDGTTYGQPAPGIAPDLDSEFHKHGPIFFAEQGVKIDVPTLLRQGASDNLFNLNQGLDIFHKALTDDARDESYFVSFNGGHALPNVAPQGKPMAAALGGGVDACTESDQTTWTSVRIDFFKRVFAGQSTDGLLPAQYNFTDLDNVDCIRTDSFTSSTHSVDPLGVGSFVATGGLGAPLHLPIADGPFEVTGVPELKGLATSLGLDNRAFFGLSMGTSPADAAVIDNNLMPLRVLRASVDKKFGIELPGVSVEVPEGQSLYLTVTPVSDMFFGHGSRTPGGFVLSDLQLSLPSPAGEGLKSESSLELRREETGKRSRLVATLTDAAGDPISHAQVDFSSEGDPLGSARTGADGEAILDLEKKYRSNDRTYEASFAGNEDYEGSSASTS